MSIQEFSGNMDVISALGDRPADTDRLSAAQLKAKFDEGNKALKKYINETLVPAVNEAAGDAESAASAANDANSKAHTHTSPLADIDDAVNKRHKHGNQTLLESYNQTNANIADAVNKRHTHENMDALNWLTGAHLSGLSSAVSENAWKLLWVNDSPGSPYSGGNFYTQGIEKCKILLFIAATSNEAPNNLGSTVFYVPDENAVQGSVTFVNYGNRIYTRGVTISNGIVSFDTAGRIYGVLDGYTSVSSAYTIPRYILGTNPLSTVLPAFS